MLYQQSDHKMFLEIERRFLRDIDMQCWSEEDYAVYDFLNSIIDCLDSGENLVVDSDTTQVEYNRYIRNYLKSLKNKTGGPL
jgi:allophanate hydrolase subunit 1